MANGGKCWHLIGEKYVLSVKKKNGLGLFDGTTLG
jgi:hypothetical protein